MIAKVETHPRMSTLIQPNFQKARPRTISLSGERLTKENDKKKQQNSPKFQQSISLLTPFFFSFFFSFENHSIQEIHCSFLALFFKIKDDITGFGCFR